jgi:hypothetical protein
MSSSADTGAVRKRAVPTYLRAATHEKILDWARKELNGVEARLDRKTLQLIQAGELKEVVLRPRKAGFFAPDGQFIEAYDYQPTFGDDLSEAEEHWTEEEADREWADGENGRFNRGTVGKGEGAARIMWEHGRRIHEYSKKTKRPAWTLLELLAKRSEAGGYAKYTHRTCLYFYRWKPDLAPDDPIMSWSWGLADAVMRFSTQDNVREHVVRALKDTSLGRLSAKQLSKLLGIRTRKLEDALPTSVREQLNSFRQELENGRLPSEDSIDRLVAILATFDSTGNDRPEEAAYTRKQMGEHP